MLSRSSRSCILGLSTVEIIELLHRVTRLSSRVHSTCSFRLFLSHVFAFMREPQTSFVCLSYSSLRPLGRPQTTNSKKTTHKTSFLPCAVSHGAQDRIQSTTAQCNAPRPSYRDYRYLLFVSQYSVPSHIQLLKLQPRFGNCLLAASRPGVTDASWHHEMSLQRVCRSTESHGRLLAFSRIPPSDSRFQFKTTVT